MSTEAKVGSFTLAALALLGFMLMHIGGFGFGGEKGYEVHAAFAQVNGLKPGNLVRYAGVDVGKVSAVTPEDDGAKATLLIHEGIKIPAGAVVSVSSDGLMGEKFVSISPGDAALEGYLNPGDTVSGHEQRGFDHLTATADDVLRDMQKLVKSLNAIFGDERLRNALIDSASNAKEVTENLNRMSEVMARMAINNEADLRAMVGNLAVMSNSMMSAAARVDAMLYDLDNGGQTTADMREAIANLNSTSRRVEAMAAAMEGVVTDPETANDIRETLRNARGVSEKADRMLNRVSGVSAEASAEVLYGAHRYMTNADLKIHTSPSDFILLGVSDIGGDDKTNLQVGTGNDKLTGRAGILENKPGIGVDSYLNPALKVSLDAYDPNDLRMRLRAQYEFAPDTFLVGQTNDINKSGDRESFIGVRHSF